MRRTFHRIVPLLLAAVLIIGLSSAVYAAEVTGEVTYNGSKVIVSDNAKQMQKTLSSLVPGDEVDIVFHMFNNGKNATDWYVKDDIARTFEDGAKSTGGAYTYSLYYKNAKGKKKVIYSNDTVGGETTNDEAPVGLRQATDGTDEYFHLDRLDAGGTGTFGIQLSVEGETHNNDYQKTLSRVNANFAVQEVSSGKTKVVRTNSNSTARTGDETKLILFITLFVIAGIMLICVLGYMFIQRRKGGSHE